VSERESQSDAESVIVGGAIRRLVADERGQTLPLLMLIMAMAMFASAFIIDMGMLYRERGLAQTAVDMAVLAAVQELPDASAAATTAIDVARANGFDDADATIDVAVTVDVDGPDVDVDGLNCATPQFCVRVTITNDHAWLFANVLSLTTATGLTSTASAEKAREPREVVFILDRSGSLSTSLDGILYEMQYFSGDTHLLPTPGSDRLGLMLFDYAGNFPGTSIARENPQDDEPQVLLALSGSFGSGGPDFSDALVLPSTVNDAAATTTGFVTALPSAVDDFYRGRILEFTSGALNGERAFITGYVGATKRVTVARESDGSPLPSAPTNGDGFHVEPGATNSDIGTGLWRSLEQFGASPLPSGVRRAVVLVSDGQPTTPAGPACGGANGANCARNAAQAAGAAGIPIYAVWVLPSNGSTSGQALMAEIAALSGGSYINAGATCAAPPGSCAAFRAQLTAIARSLGIELIE